NLGPFPRSFPVLKRTCTVDAPPHPAVSSFLSVSPNIFCSKGILRHATVSYIRFPLRQGMVIKMCSAQNRRWLPYVWEPPSQAQSVNKLTIPLPVTSGRDTMPLCTVTMPTTRPSRISDAFFTDFRYTSYKHATSASSLL
ncbi:hypothetical protein CABS01_15421, partial [Colletotrichum abscissum]|uniref:uncharacterized protein n=1 Tax=Colletotrichum abscissum TaxID=1671311 RepID=UPI0027D75974